MGLVLDGEILVGGENIAIQGLQPQGMAVDGEVIWEALQTQTFNLFTNNPQSGGASQGNYVLGFLFSSNVAGSVIGFKAFTQSAQTLLFSLWDASTGVLVGSATGSGSADSWIEATPSTPIPIVVNKNYWATFYAPSGSTWWYQWSSYSWPVVSGPLTATTGGYSTGPNSMPNSGTGSISDTRWFGNDIDVECKIGPPLSTWSFFTNANIADGINGGAGSGGYTFGVKFNSSVAGSIVSFTLYAPAASQSLIFGLWDAISGVLLGSTIVSVTKDTLVTATLAQPISIVAGKDYWATYCGTTGTTSWYQWQPFAFPVTSGPLTATIGGYGGGSNIMPNATDSPPNTRWFGNDVVFEKAGPPPPSQPWTPLNLTGLVAWYDAQDSATRILSGANLTQWNDKSGNGYNATGSAVQTGASNTAINGFPAANFSGTDALMASVSPGSFPSAITLYVVVNNTTSSGLVRRIDPTSAAAAPMVWNSGTVYLGNGVPGALGVPSGYAAWNSPTLFGGSWDGATYSDWVNASQVTNTPTPTGVYGDTATYAILGFTSGWLGNGYLGESIWVSGVLSTNDRQKLEGYLAWKWGMQANLPGGHPYVSAPP